MKIGTYAEIYDSHVTELIASNYAKRELGILPDEWYVLDATLCGMKRYDLLPSEEQQRNALIREVIRRN